MRLLYPDCHVRPALANSDGAPASERREPLATIWSLRLNYFESRKGKPRQIDSEDASFTG
jgi:hypothetical protein